MFRPPLLRFGLVIGLLGSFVTLAAQHPHQQGDAKKGEESASGRAPEELPRIPRPDRNAADLPRGYRVEVVFDNLTYPTSVEFDDAGAMYIAEGGYSYGDEIAPARILRVPSKGESEVVADQLSAPITDLLWHGNRLYISHRGKISVLESDGVRDLVTGLPSLGDHHNNQMTIGPDGKLYFGQGVATNSGVVGLDNFKIGWLAKYPDVHDVPAKDIRLTDQAFETADVLDILSEKRKGPGAEEGKGSDDKSGAHKNHGEKNQQQKRKSSEAGQKHDDHDRQNDSANGQRHKAHYRGPARYAPGTMEADASDGSGQRAHQADAVESVWDQPLLTPWEMHPLLNHFPIAFLLGAVALDLFAQWRKRSALVQTATALLIAGVLFGILTALAGWLAFATVPAHTDEAHALMYWHLGVQLASLVLFACAALLRWRNWEVAPSLAARVIGLLAAGLLTIGSYLGGHIVYRGGAGIDPELLIAELREGHSHEKGPSEGAAESSEPQHAEELSRPGRVDDTRSRSNGRPSLANHDNHEADSPSAGDAPSEKAREHDASKGKGSQKGDEGHQAHGKQAEKAQHNGHGGGGKGDEHSQRLVKTFAFQPFGKTPPDDGAIRGTTKASGTILRMNPDGSNLEVYAWGLRNPFGVMWGPDENLYASDNGYDERGSRPIAHAPDSLWVIKKDAWYGFPDYAGGIPVTDARFQPEQGPVPKFLMRDHPSVEKPLLTLPQHVGAAKMDFSHSAKFGFNGHLFLALVGDMNPITGAHEERSGFEVTRIDPETGKSQTFFKAKKSALGPKGMEYVATAGPRRPVDVQFSQDGDTLYVVDVGAMAIIPTATGPVPRPFPGSGVIWRITRFQETAR